MAEDISNYYIESGSGEAFILLHGNGEDHSYFKNQIGFFSKTRRVIALDTRGHGKTPRGVKPFTIEQFADDLSSFMEEHSIEKADILGFSDGGNIALVFTLKYPQKVKKLVINGANLYPKGLRTYVRLQAETVYLFSKMFSKISKKAKRRAELYALMAVQPHIDPSSLRSVFLPVLVIAGTKDMIKKEHTELIAKSIPGSRLLFIEGSHFVAAEEPEKYNRAVEEFLEAEDER